jgi:dolichol-phosphate mannosyltransferase
VRSKKRAGRRATPNDGADHPHAGGSAPGAGPAHGFLVIPAFNEAAGLPDFLGRLAAVAGTIHLATSDTFTILVVDDASTDDETAVLARLAQAPLAAGVSLRSISLVRNFGHQAALVAGLLEAARAGADFAITLDADGEHPVELVPRLIEKWREGASLVHTVRRPHPQVDSLKRLASDGYYWVLRRLSGLRISAGMADFKLWDGGLLRQVADFLPRCGSTRAFAVWLSPDGPALPYAQNVVAGRTSRLTWGRMWQLALGGLTRYSDLPLRLAMLTGLVALLFALAVAAQTVWAFLTGRTVPGYPSLLIAVAVFGALNAFAIGILSEYLLRNLFRQALPSFVLSRSAGPGTRPAAARRREASPSRRAAPRPGARRGGSR